jgi:HK97 family phage major capsid protein
VTRLNALQRQLDELQAEMDTIEEAATAEDRDMTDTEEKAYNGLVDRAATLNKQIQTATGARMALLEAGNALHKANAGVTTVDRGAKAPEPPELTAGEFFAEWLQLHHPDGHRDPERFLDRAARYIDRAQQATADTAGILPVPIVGNVIKLSDSRRPAWMTLTHPGMPAKGKQFTRPRITQRASVGTQTEGQALASQKMTVVADTVTKATYGGTLELTLQDIEWTEPEALQLVVQDFVDLYVEYVESQALAFLAAQVAAADAASNGSGHSPWTTTNISTITDSIIDGILKVYGKAKRMPDVFLLDLASWGALASTTNATTDKGALAIIKENLNEAGFDLTFAVSPAAAADTRLLYASSLSEGYERQRGLLRGEKVSTLSAELAYSGDVAFYGRHEGIVSLAADPTP